MPNKNDGSGWLSLVVDERPICKSEKCGDPVDDGRDIHPECEEGEDSWLGLILQDGDRL